MPQFAIIEPFTGWERILPTARVKAFQGKEHLVLDSVNLSKKEVSWIRRNKVPACPYCESRLFYRRAFERGHEKVHPHWFHRGGKECFQAETAAHAMTKRFIHQKMEERGYRIKEERRHKIGDKHVVADVAVFVNEQGIEELRLVVEVQASKPTVAEIQKKIAVYAAEQVPVAWVLLLDTFFYGYTMDTQGEDPVPDKKYSFAFSGTNPVFEFLMDTYQYVIGIREDGRVFLLRLTPHSAERKARAEALGLDWSYQDNDLDATLIRDDKIADVLLYTPVIPMEYESTSREKKEPKQIHHEFTGKDCEWFPDDTPDDSFIDFASGRTLEGNLDPIALIQETKEALAQARKRIEEEKRRKEERKKREEQAKKEAEQNQLSVEQKRLEQARKEAELHPFNEEAYRRWKAIQNEIEERMNQEAPPPRLNEAERNRFVENRLKQENERGLAKLRRIEKQEQKKEQLEQLKEQLQQGKEIAWTEEQQNLIWSEYKQLSHPERRKWEVTHFVTGIEPPWFTHRKLRLEAKEYREQKREKRRQKKREQDQKKEKKQDMQQIELDF